MREIIFKTNSKVYRWRPTRWMKAVGYGLATATILLGGYCWMLLIYGWKMGM